MTQRYDAVGAPDKPHPHGTGMAGAIAARQRLLGTAPAARILAVHAFSTSVATPESTTFNILKGINWAVGQGTRVINMSFAGPKDPSLERALKAASDRNTVLIAAAGNAGPKSPPLYPGADPNVIAVTATDIDDKLFPGANRGKYISVAAPGVDILVPAPENTYQITTGTSVAAAEVSGIVALLLERNPKLTPADIRRILHFERQAARRRRPRRQFRLGPSRSAQGTTARYSANRYHDSAADAVVTCGRPVGTANLMDSSPAIDTASSKQLDAEFPPHDVSLDFLAVCSSADRTGQHGAKMHLIWAPKLANFRS